MEGGCHCEGLGLLKKKQLVPAGLTAVTWKWHLASRPLVCVAFEWRLLCSENPCPIYNIVCVCVSVHYTHM